MTFQPRPRRRLAIAVNQRRLRAHGWMRENVAQSDGAAELRVDACDQSRRAQAMTAGFDEMLLECDIGTAEHVLPQSKQAAFGRQLVGAAGRHRKRARVRFDVMSCHVGPSDAVPVARASGSTA